MNNIKAIFKFTWIIISLASVSCDEVGMKSGSLSTAGVTAALQDSGNLIPQILTPAQIRQESSDLQAAAYGNEFVPISANCSGIFSSKGDPHEANSCGAKWNDYQEGTFTAIKVMTLGDPLPASQDTTNTATKQQRFMVIKTQKKVDPAAKAAYNTKAAALLGESIVSYDAIQDGLLIDTVMYKGEQFPNGAKLALKDKAWIYRKDSKCSAPSGTCKAFFMKSALCRERLTYLAPRRLYRQPLIPISSYHASSKIRPSVRER